MGRFLRIYNGVARSFDEASSISIYDQSVTILGGGLSTGLPLTLPTSQTYSNIELEVYLNGVRLEPIADYSYVGSIPRTQISFTFDLIATDVIRFRIDRGA